MALANLADYDLLDLILASEWDDEKQFEMLESYNELFKQYLEDELGSSLTEKDTQDVEKLLDDPTLNAEKLIQFYKDRIPSLEAKIVGLTLLYKKTFVINVYLKKLKAYETSSIQEGKEAWEQIYKDAIDDNWNEVMRLINVLKSQYGQKTPSPSPSDASTASAVS